MNRNPIALALVAAILWLGSGARAEEVPPSATPQDILSFAATLLQSGDSYRAATEYLRYLHHYAGESGQGEALEGLGRAYALADRHDDAVRVFRHLLATEGNAPAETPWLLGASLYEGRRYSEATEVLLGAPDEASQVLGTLALLRGDPEGKLAAKSRKDIAAEFRTLQRKSPGVAGSLSAVLPGAGHFYCGRPRDGTVSFLLNAVFLWGIYESVQQENWPVAGILGFFELGWYSGNIVSSANAAHKWNRREEGRFFRRWEEGAVPQWNLSVLPQGLGGTVSWNW